MNVVYLCGSPYKTTSQIAEELHISKRTVQDRQNEIEDEVEKGRYSKLAVIRDGPKIVLINFLVFIDYMNNRQFLKQKNLRKLVDPFDAMAIAREIGWYGSEVTECDAKQQNT